MWTKKERVMAVLNGQLADRPPVSAWRHFPEKEHDAVSFAGAMLEFQKTYDWDYVKLQNRATYYEEAWGGEFDYTAYNGGNVAPCTKAPINSAADLEKIVELPASTPVFAEQVEATKLFLKGLGEEIPTFPSIFSPTAAFQKMCKVDSIGRYRVSSREDLMVTLMHENPGEVHRALKNITRTLAGLSQEMVKTGVFGIFFAPCGLSRTGYLTREEWEEFVRPYDLELLEAMKPCKIMLHACGIYSNPAWYADYPIHILHWAESAVGNAPLVSAPGWLGKITPMGGVDERPFGKGDPAVIDKLAKETLKKMKDIPFLLAPDCSVAQNTAQEEFLALYRAVHEIG